MAQVNSSDLVVTFGKHAGCKIKDLPTSYLKWCAENLSEKNPTTKKVCLAADLEYQKRRNGEADDLVFDEDEDGFMLDAEEDDPIIDKNFILD